MARRNYKRYASKRYSGAKSYGKRSYGGFKARTANSPVKLNIGMEWLAGFGVGMTNLDNQIPTNIKLIGATMPVGGKIGGKAKAVSQGMIAGNIVQHYLKFRTGGNPATGSGDGI